MSAITSRRSVRAGAIVAPFAGVTGAAYLTPSLGTMRAATFCWGRSVRDSAGDVLPLSELGWFFGAFSLSLALQLIGKPLLFLDVVAMEDPPLGWQMPEGRGAFGKTPELGGPVCG